jgi:hypothetical protein
MNLGDFEDIGDLLAVTVCWCGLQELGDVLVVQVCSECLAEVSTWSVQMRRMMEVVGVDWASKREQPNS